MTLAYAAASVTVLVGVALSVWAALIIGRRRGALRLRVDHGVTATRERHAGDLVSDLLAAARRATGVVRRQTRYYAFVSDDNGNYRVFRIWATNLAEAEREAHHGARRLNMTVAEVRPAVRLRRRVY